jgi:hypothetical protein
MTADDLKQLSGEDLDAAGARMHLDRVSKAKGHAFDESDDSYRRRLMAVIVGAAAADAMSQPAVIEGDPMAPPKGLIEAPEDEKKPEDSEKRAPEDVPSQDGKSAKDDPSDSDSKLP